MNLTQTLDDIALQLELDPMIMRSYATEDQHEGYPHEAGGSIWRVEGQVLYALVRALNAQRILELGTSGGVSTVHLAEAALATGGHVTTLDTWPHAGECIPPRLVSHVTLVNKDAIMYLWEQRGAVDFIFEDLDHERETVRQVAELARDRLAPGGILVSHDAMHRSHREAVQGGYADAGLWPAYYLIEPSDCGLAVWRKAS